MLSQHGVHGPNCAFKDYPAWPNNPGTPSALWWRLGASGARWIKLLAGDHTRADAQAARDRGLRVLVRAAGEGIVYDHDVLALLAQFAGVADVLEIGNEPYPTAAFPTWDALLWNHAVYLEAVLHTCAAEARAAGVQLCAPAWRSPFPPPLAGTVLPGDGAALADYTVPPLLAARLKAVYGAFAAQAVHCFDPWSLTGPQQQARVAAWWGWSEGLPIYISEYGIAATTLLPSNPHDRAANDSEKARRYASFVNGLPSYVVAAFLFLLGGTNDFAQFNGTNSYWLDDHAWQVLGKAIG